MSFRLRAVPVFFDYRCPTWFPSCGTLSTPYLLPIARDWAEKAPQSRRPGRTTLDEWLAMCHAAGQPRSTPILLRLSRKRLERAASRSLR
ncbi:2OG-Fe(II) oxygenase [Fodinicola feengrottensis]|uniref:2OG-Fe(II) oxygenase n=1 Tax=Fodinicola feengrottensis TaxID=435914 RepID=UPI0013D7DDE0